MTFLLKKVISGGQTGADLGGLLAARELGFETGGTAPKGWLTETGPEKDLLRSFGLVECEQKGFPARTRRNVETASATLLVGPYRTGGSRLTYQVAQELKKPLFLLPFPSSADADHDRCWHWLERYSVQVLNVAGNRESQSPGIGAFTRDFLVSALRKGKRRRNWTLPSSRKGGQ